MHLRVFLLFLRKNNIMKLIYIANIRLSTEKTHEIQIMKMCIFKKRRQNETYCFIYGVNKL